MPDLGYLGAWLLGLIVFFGIVLLLFVAIRWGTRVLLGPRSRLEEELALEVLRGRLARGEISEEEFTLARRALGR